MKIALFHNVTSGGAKRTIFEHIKRLTDRHRVDLFSLSCAEHKFGDVQAYVNHTEILSFKVLPLLKSPLGRLNQGLRIVDLLRLRGVMCRLAEKINGNNYDVALIHPCMFTVSPTILRYIRIPALYYRHDPVRWVQDPAFSRSCNEDNIIRRRLDIIDPLLNAYHRLLVHEDVTSMRAATQVVTNSYFMRESLYRIYGVAPAVSYHGVDHNLFRPLNLDRQNFVMSVGAIAPYKGYDFLIRSLACIPAGSRPRLILVGNAALPHEQNYLVDLAARLGVDVDFRHLISNDDLVRLYNQAIATVYAPMMEPFGLVPLESMACGTPVVGIREGGVRETVIHNQTGLLADRDPEQFATAIVTLLEDRFLIECLGKQGRECVEQQWGWQKAITTLEKYLKQVAELKSRK